MIKWSFIFLIIALVAGLLGFGVIASAAAGIAKFLFFLFLILFIGSLFLGTFFVKKVKNTFSGR